MALHNPFYFGSHGKVLLLFIIYKSRPYQYNANMIAEKGTYNYSYILPRV